MALALASEELDRLAESLRAQAGIGAVSTSLFMRGDRDAGLLEKCVEWVLNPSTGEVAAWVLEVSLSGGAWHIYTRTSISHGDYFEAVDDVNVSVEGDLAERLRACVEALIATNAEAAGFRREIERIRSRHRNENVAS